MKKKNSELDKFLNGLTDHELSIFVGYRYHGFLKDSQKKLMHEINKRKLTKDYLANLYNTPLDLKVESGTALCQRCGSNRVFNETDIEYRSTSNYNTREVEVDTIRCRLCGYNPAKAKPKNLLGRIKRLFNSNKTKKTIRKFDWTGREM